MNMQYFYQVESYVAEQLQQSRSYLIQGISTFHQACNDAVLAQLSERAHLNFDLPDVNPLHCPMPSDAFKAIYSRLSDTQQALSGSDKVEYAPPFAPSFGDALASEVIKSSVIPASTTAGLMDYLVYFSLSQIVNLRNQKQYILRRGFIFNIFDGVYKILAQIDKDILWFCDFSARVLALCYHASIEIAESTLTEFYKTTAPCDRKYRIPSVAAINDIYKTEFLESFDENEWAQRVLYANDPYITVDDLKVVLRHYQFYQSLMDSIWMGMQHLAFIDRQEIIDTVIMQCTKRSYSQFSYFTDIYDMIAEISAHSDIDVSYAVHLPNEKAAFLQAHLDRDNDTEKLILAMLEQSGAYSNQQVEFEYYCSRILCYAIVRHQSFADDLPSFIQAGYKITQNSPANSVQVRTPGCCDALFLTCMQASEYIQKADCVASVLPAREPFDGSIFDYNVGSVKHSSVGESNQVNSLPPPSVFRWKTSVKECDFSLNFLLGLLTASDAQNRYYAAEAFIDKEIYRNIAVMEKLGCQVSGRAQITRALHLTRFDKFSYLYGRFVVLSSEALCRLRNITAKIESFSVSAADSRPKASNAFATAFTSAQNDSSKKSDLDLLRFAYAYYDFNENVYFEQDVLQILRKASSNFETFAIEQDGYCVDVTGYRIVFSQAISDVTTVLLHDYSAIQTYIERLHDVGYRKYLECLAYSEEYLYIKYDSYAERQAHVLALSDAELYDTLGEERKALFEQYNASQYIDTMYIVFDTLLAECHLYQAKTRLIALLEEVALFCGADYIQIIKNLVYQIYIARPQQFEDFSAFKTQEEEQGRCFLEFEKMQQIDRFVIDNMQMVEAPATQLQVLRDAYEMFSELVSTIIQLQYDYSHKAGVANDIIINNRHYALQESNYQYWVAVEVVFTLFYTCAEIYTVFTSECFAKINQGVRAQEGNKQFWYSYPLYTTKLNQAIHYAVACFAVRFLTQQVLEYYRTGSSCFCVLSNLQHLVDPGFLADYEFLYYIVEKVVCYLKQEEPVAAEKVFCSIVGLLAPQGGSCENLVESSATRYFMLCLTLRDLYLKADKSSQTQLQYLQHRCNFTTFSGVPAVLPLPFQLYARVLNVRHSFGLMQRALVMSHYLRLSEISCLRATTECKIETELVTLFYRGQLQAERCTYREMYGYQSMMNNLPFLATLDKDAYKELITNFDLSNPEFIARMLKSNDFSLSGELDAAQNSYYTCIRDVLLSANMETAARFPLFYETVAGIIGVFARAAYVEYACNALKLANLRANQTSVDFCIASECVASYGRKTSPAGELSGKVYPRKVFKYYDSNGFFERADVSASPAERFQYHLSSYYFNASEDILASLAQRAYSEYQFRMRTYHAEELSYTLVFAHTQQIAFIIGTAVVAEVRRLGAIAYAKGLLSVLRSELADIDRDDACLLVSAFPIYRGKKQGYALTAEQFILTDECSLAHIYYIPHPIAIGLHYSSTTVINALCIILYAYESAVRHALIRTTINGQNPRKQAGKMITAQLAFLQELESIYLQDDDEKDIDVATIDAEFAAMLKNRAQLTSVAMENAQRYSVRLDTTTCLTEADIGTIRANVRKVQENIALVRQNHGGQVNDRYETTQALEFTKTLLALYKSVELRDKNELVVAAGIVQAYNACTRKGLFEYARYLQTLLQNLNIKCGMHALLYDADFALNGARSYALTQQYAFCRIFRAYLYQDPRIICQQYNFNAYQTSRPYAFYQERGTVQNQSQYAYILLSDEVQYLNQESAPEFKPLPSYYYLEPNYYRVSAVVDFYCAQHISMEYKSENGCLVSLQDIDYLITRIFCGINGSGFAYRNFGHPGIPMVQHENQHSYVQQPYFVDTSDALYAMAYGVLCFSPFNRNLVGDICQGYGVDGTYSVFAPFGINARYFLYQHENTLQPFFCGFSRSLEAALCSSVTQIELCAIQHTKGQNQWYIVQDTAVICRARLLTDRLERMVLFSHGLDENSKDSILISYLGILGSRCQNLYSSMFKSKIDTVADEQSQHSQYGQSKVQLTKYAKQKEQQQFLQLSLPLYLEERSIENVLDDASCAMFKYNIEDIKRALLSSLAFYLQASAVSNLAQYFNRRSYFIEDSLRYCTFASEYTLSNDLETSFCKFVYPYAQQISDLLVLACRERGVQISVKDPLEAMISVLGLAQESTDALHRVLAYEIPAEPEKDYNTSSLKYIIVKHEFLPADVICWALAALRSIYIAFTTHTISTRFFRGLNLLIETPERRFKDPHYDGLLENAVYFRAGPFGDFFKFRILRIYYADLMRFLTEEDAPSIATQLESYYQFNKLRVMSVGAQQLKSTLRTYVQSAAESSKLRESLEARSIALLDPLALPQMRLMYSLEEQLYSAFEEYLDNEYRLRAELHDRHISRVLEYNTKLIKTNYALRKAQLLARFIESDALQQRNQDARYLAARLYYLAGIEIDSEPETLRLAEFARDEQRQSVVENYQQSIAECTRALYNLQIKTLMYYNLANYRQSISQKRLQKQHLSAQNGIVGAFSELYSDVIKSAYMDNELLGQLARVTALISQKYGEIEDTKRLTQQNIPTKRPKTAGSTAAAKSTQIQSAMQYTLQQQMAYKILPQLQNSAVEKSIKACSEGETLLIRYKHLSEEGKELQQRFYQIMDALRVMREKYAVDRYLHQQMSKKEKQIIKQQEQQSEALQCELDQLKVLGGEILYYEQQKLRTSGDVMTVKLRAEIDAVKKQRYLWQQKNQDLRTEYDELFRLLE